jgi:peptide/nickel transport system permease protein
VKQYIAQRCLLAIPTLILITIATFVGLRVLLPVSVVDRIIGEYGRNDPVLRANLEEDLGLSGSVASQYAEWVFGLLRGDLGESLHSGRAISTELKERVPVSLELGLVASLLWSIPIGVWSAVRQDRWPDYIARGLAILVSSIPPFWIAVVIITLASHWFQWAPPIKYRDFWEDPLAHIKIMFLPSLIIALTPAGGLIRLVRTTMLEVLRQDYIRTAQAKGLSSGAVFYNHALRNGLLPVVTVVGVALPTLLAGTVVFEQIFIIPGMGRYLVSAVIDLDYPVIQATNLIFALLLLLAVLAVDISYAFIDPRIRYH